MSEHGVRRNGQIQVRVNRLEGAVHRRNRRTRRGIVAALTASFFAGILATAMIVDPAPARVAEYYPVAIDVTASVEEFGSPFGRAVASLPDCAVEDGSDVPVGSSCRWLADETGNGAGVSFWVHRDSDSSGTYHYADGTVVSG